jgi:hypothetical protein
MNDEGCIGIFVATVLSVLVFVAIVLVIWWVA